MKYQFALERNSDRLLLTTSIWHGETSIQDRGLLISLQIIEDFTAKEYFNGYMRSQGR